MSQLVLSVLKLNLAIPIYEEQKRFWRTLALTVDRHLRDFELNGFKMKRGSFMTICSFLMGTVEDNTMAESFFTHYTSEGIWAFSGNVDFNIIWKRALGNGDKAVVPVSLLKTAHTMAEEKLQITHFVKSQIAKGQFCKKLGSSTQIMTIWSRATKDFSVPFTTESAINVAEKRMLKHQTFVINQLIKSELFLQSKLSVLLSDYATPLKTVISPEIHRSFFSEITKLQVINAKLLTKLQTQLEIDTNIGPIFLDFAESLTGFMTYFQYSVAHNAQLKELNTNKLFRNFFKKTNKVSVLELQTLLSVPLQHIRKYGLQLQEQLQWTPCIRMVVKMEIRRDDMGNYCCVDPQNLVKVGFKDRTVNGKRFVVVVQNSTAKLRGGFVGNEFRVGDSIIAVDQQGTSTVSDLQRIIDQNGMTSMQEVDLVCERYSDMGEALEVVTQSVQGINDGMETGQRRYIFKLFERAIPNSGAEMVMLGYDLLSATVVTKFVDINSLSTGALARNNSRAPPTNIRKRTTLRRAPSKGSQRIDSKGFKLMSEPPQEVRRLVIFSTHIVLTTIGEDTIERIEPKNIYMLPIKQMKFNQDSATITLRLIAYGYSEPVELQICLKSVATNQTFEQFNALEQQLSADCWHVVDGVPYATVPDLLRRATPSVDSLRRLICEYYNEKIPKRRGKRFTDVMNAFPIIWSSQHRHFLQNIYSNKPEFEALMEKTNVYTYELFGTDALKHIVTSLATPKPPMMVEVPVDVVMQGAGYNPRHRFKKRLTSNRHDRPPFVVAGPVVLNIDGKPDPEFEKRNLCVVHAEGMNFSSSNTGAYKVMYEKKSDERFRTLVRGRLRMVFHLCFQAAKDLGCTTIRMPAIGLGDFTLACDKKRIKMIEDEFVAQLLWANANCPSVFLSARFPHHDKISELDMLESVKEDNVCLVNPVDFEGFLGDGGGLSETMVNATTEAEGKGACNSAVLHNALFNARLLSPVNYKLYPLDSVNVDIEASSTGLAKPTKKWARYLLVFHANNKHTKFKKGYHEKLSHDFDMLKAEFDSLKKNVCCKRLVELNLSDPHIQKKLSHSAQLCFHVDGKRMRTHIQKIFPKIMAQSVQGLSIPRKVASQVFDAQSFFNLERVKRYHAGVEYFMGGEERLTALRKLFQTCNSVCKEGGAVSQLRILTRANWSDVFKLMSLVNLAEHVHSLWDSSGSGILTASGQTVQNDKDFTSVQHVALWAREVSVDHVVYVEDMTDIKYRKFLMAKDAQPGILKTLSADLSAQLHHVMAEARFAQKLYEAQKHDPKARAPSLPSEPPSTPRGTPRGQPIVRMNSKNKWRQSKRCSVDYAPIGTNDSGQFGMDVERLEYEKEGMDTAFMAKLKAIVNHKLRMGKSVLVVLDFDCTVTKVHWSKAIYNASEVYSQAFKKWREANIDVSKLQRVSKSQKLISDIVYF